MFRTRGCGRVGRPAFPAPSEFLGERFCKTSGDQRREIAMPYPQTTLFEN
jgi:hypothetical protein